MTWTLKTKSKAKSEVAAEVRSTMSKFFNLTSANEKEKLLRGFIFTFAQCVLTTAVLFK